LAFLTTNTAREYPIKRLVSRIKGFEVAVEVVLEVENTPF